VEFAGGAGSLRVRLTLSRSDRHPQIGVYPPYSSAIGIIALARKREMISWNQLPAGKILLANDLDDDFRIDTDILSISLA
jgi:hypothetical protein